MNRVIGGWQIAGIGSLSSTYFALPTNIYPNGNKIEMAAASINVKGQMIVVEGTQVMLGGQGGEPVIKGTSFLPLFATHIHPTAFGPTGPPIPQGEMSSLSTKVLTT